MSRNAKQTVKKCIFVSFFPMNETHVDIKSTRTKILKSPCNEPIMSSLLFTLVVIVCLARSLHKQIQLVFIYVRARIMNKLMISKKKNDCIGSFLIKTNLCFMLHIKDEIANTPNLLISDHYG